MEVRKKIITIEILSNENRMVYDVLFKGRR